MKEIQPNSKHNADDQSSTDEHMSSTFTRKRQSIDSSAIKTSFRSQRTNVNRVFADLSNLTPTTPTPNSDQQFTTPESIFSSTNHNNSGINLSK